eukprot:gene30555-32885_t
MWEMYVEYSASKEHAAPSEPRPSREWAGAECPVCLEDLPPPASAGSVTLAPCGHVLCAKCARGFTAGKRCPMCRAPVAAQ